MPNTNPPYETCDFDCCSGNRHIPEDQPIYEVHFKYDLESEYNILEEYYFEDYAQNYIKMRLKAFPKFTRDHYIIKEK